MAILDLFRREKALTASPAVVEAIRGGNNLGYRRLGGTNQQVNAAWLQWQSCSYAYIYQQQPAVRTVVDYIARNLAQLGLKLYERVDDTERRRDTDHPAAETMEHPNDLGPADAWVRAFASDFLVHDNAYALKFRSEGVDRRILVIVPPPAVAINSNARYTIDSYRIYRSDGTYIDVPPDDVIHWRGYNPEDPRMGVSRLETLRQVLAEDNASQTASVELMKAGLSKPGYIKRPLEAADWSEEARKRFQESWANQSKKSPRQTPVLEEGMEFADFGVTPKDAEMLAGRRFTLETVARLYGMENVPPEDEEERSQFLTDVLAPLAESFSNQLCFSILEAEYGLRDYYFEFDLNEKMRGDPEKRFSALTTSAGRPWLTVNEARARENLPPVEDGDELTVPLNVTVGDNPLPAPNQMPIQDPNKPPQDGSYREDALLHGEENQIVAVVKRHLDRQERAIRSDPQGTFVLERWDRELTQDLVPYVGDKAGALAAEVNRATERALDGTPPASAFAQLKADATRWASDIDRARVMLVAASLLDASEAG